MNAVFLFPGQGSQYVGMGKEFYEHSPAVRDFFEQASGILEMDLRKLCFEGPEATLVQTENVQPAVTLINLACFQVLKEEGIRPAAAAGHSLGEYAALYAAGVLSFADALDLVRHRGRYMLEAATEAPGGMIAVIGLEIELLQAICQRAGEIGSVEVANHNSPRQIILTGETEALKQAGELAKKEGAKLIIPLKVSGPWHSRFMQPASRKMAEALAKCTVNPPTIPVVSNVTGDFYNDPEEIRACLVQQIVRPVEWVDSIERLLQEGHRRFIEVGPGRVLSGLMRDISKEAKVINVEKPDGLAKLKAWGSDPVVPNV